MSFMLKIVEGPNKGAEIALVDGVAVSLGKRDDCDIVLADPTMPAEPLRIEVSGGGVALNGEALELFAVKTFGATSFAAGPADAPWGALAWPKPDKPEPVAEAAETKMPERAAESAPPAAPEQKKRRGCLGCLVAIVPLILILAVLGWMFREKVSVWTERARELADGIRAQNAEAAGEEPAPEAQLPGAATIEDVAGRYSLSLEKDGDLVRVSGNLVTRRERLAATAEAYEAMPGVELDLSDDESFRTAAEDAVFNLTEGSLNVQAATNRCLQLSGTTPSAAALEQTLKALAADLPKMRQVDVAAVALAGTDQNAAGPGDPTAKGARAAKAAAVPSLPVCGILTAPYPCLVMKNGERILDGAAIGDWTIESIGADNVVLTNATGRFVWRP